MSDYEAIRHLIAGYTRAADALDPEGYANLFAQDGALIEHGVRIGPRAKLRALMEKGHELHQVNAGRQVDFDRHLQVNTTIELDGERAEALTDFVILRVTETGWKVRGTGTYVDDIVKEADGRWRFKTREVEWAGGIVYDGTDPGEGERMAEVFRSVMADDRARADDGPDAGEG